MQLAVYVIRIDQANPCVYSQLCDDNLDIPEPKTVDDVAQIYFEVFNIQPVKLNLSFVRTQGVNIVDERLVKV